MKVVFVLIWRNVECRNLFSYAWLNDHLLPSTRIQNGHTHPNTQNDACKCKSRHNLEGNHHCVDSWLFGICLIFFHSKVYTTCFESTPYTRHTPSIRVCFRGRSTLLKTIILSLEWQCYVTLQMRKAVDNSVGMFHQGDCHSKWMFRCLRFSMN